eukprot:1155735-Pelagomonas_calceolata.AAC.11
MCYRLSTTRPEKGGKPIVEAGEGHGPRKEFFQLAGTDMCRQDKRLDSQKPLFIHNRTAGAYWYNTNLKEVSRLPSATKEGKKKAMQSKTGCMH